MYVDIVILFSFTRYKILSNALHYTHTRARAPTHTNTEYTLEASFPFAMYELTVPRSVNYFQPNNIFLLLTNSSKSKRVNIFND